MAVIEEFRTVFEDDSIAKTGHNLKYDVTLLKWHGVDVKKDGLPVAFALRGGVCAYELFGTKRTKRLACLHPFASFRAPVSKDLDLFRKVAERIPGCAIEDRTEVLPKLRAYEEKIRDTIGVRQQSRLPEGHTVDMAGCLAFHRDVSLYF